MKRRLKLGDIYEISLPNGQNAYGRLFKEYTLAIYQKRCHSVDELPGTDITLWTGLWAMINGKNRLVDLLKRRKERLAYVSPVFFSSCCPYGHVYVCRVIFFCRN